jgi:hypothetical protein
VDPAAEQAAPVAQRSEHEHSRPFILSKFIVKPSELVRARACLCLSFMGQYAGFDGSWQWCPWARSGTSAVHIASALLSTLPQVHFVKAAELITDAVAEEKGNIAYGFSKVCDAV